MSKQTYPIVVKAYLDGQGFLEALLGFPEPRPKIIAAMLALNKAKSKESDSKEAGRLAGEALSEADDPNVTLILFDLWLQVCQMHNQLAEVKILLDRARGLISSETPPEFHAAILKREGFFAASLGDKAGSERFMNQALDFLPASARQRKLIVFHRVHLLALDGRISVAEADLDWLSTQDFWKSRVALMRCVGFSETGRVKEALAQIPDIEHDPVVTQTYRDNYEFARTLIEFMSNASQSPSARGTTQERPVWAQSTQMLLERKPGESLLLARQHAAAGEETNGLGFDSSCLIRAELAGGNGEAARRLLDRRRSVGNTHYLDDLYFARIELLAGNRETAARHFAAAARACEQYRAGGRLDFELRLACEVSAGDLVTLARSAERLSARTPRQESPAKVSNSDEPRGIERLIGRSPAMTALRESILRFAPLDVPVLISGETGTGKELVAQAIHETGPRAGAPYLAVNCGAITESLLETEIFGHEKGAFTGASQAHRGIFEEAGKGTVLLDEIGEISPRLQVTLLRVLETGEIRPVGSATTRRIHCRILAATNADLERLTAEGRFRKDLLYRLRRLTVHIEPLRARRGDILVLADFFLSADRRDGRRPVMSPELRAVFEQRDWPGNIRELKNEIERMRLLNSDRLDYSLADFEKEAAPHAGDASAPPVRQSASSRPADISEENLLLSGRTPLRRAEKIRQLFTRHGKLTRAEIIRLMAISGNTASSDLKRLCDEGIIEKIMPTASPRTHYFALRKTGN
ncbi:MAG: sigma 54-interacting transcriptional regulator [Planctomycetota bacterium]